MNGSTALATEATSLETELVLGLLRRVGNPDEVDSRLREIADANPDWHAILELVSRHRLHAVLRRTLDEAAVTAPEEIETMLTARNHETSVENLQHSRQLYEIVELFRSNDIAALPYKGPVLAEAAYGSVGDRSFGDLDLLVATEDVAAACDLLERRGYERINFAGVSVERLIDGTVFRWGKEFRFVDPEGGFPVELRFGFIGGRRSDTEIFSDLWERRTSSTLTGQSLATLSPEDRALLLLVHGTKHGWRQLSWVYDVALVCRQGVDASEEVQLAVRRVVRNRSSNRANRSLSSDGSTIRSRIVAVVFLGSESDRRASSERSRFGFDVSGTDHDRAVSERRAVWSARRRSRRDIGPEKGGLRMDSAPATTVPVVLFRSTVPPLCYRASMVHG
jgi:hypothetical protein